MVYDNALETINQCAHVKWCQPNLCAIILERFCEIKPYTTCDMQSSHKMTRMPQLTPWPSFLCRYIRCECFLRRATLKFLAPNNSRGVAACVLLYYTLHCMQAIQLRSWCCVKVLYCLCHVPTILEAAPFRKAGISAPRQRCVIQNLKWGIFSFVYHACRYCLCFLSKTTSYCLQEHYFPTLLAYKGLEHVSPDRDLALFNLQDNFMPLYSWIFALSRI